jgi:hypothetical protein
VWSEGLLYSTPTGSERNRVLDWHLTPKAKNTVGCGGRNTDGNNVAELITSCVRSVKKGGRSECCWGTRTGRQSNAKQIWQYSRKWPFLEARHTMSHPPDDFFVVGVFADGVWLGTGYLQGLLLRVSHHRDEKWERRNISGWCRTRYETTGYNCVNPSRQ